MSVANILDRCYMVRMPVIKTKKRKRSDIKNIKTLIKQLEEAISKEDGGLESESLAYLINNIVEYSYKSGIDIESVLDKKESEYETMILFEEEIEEELNEEHKSHIPDKTNIVYSGAYGSVKLATWQDEDGNLVKPLKFTRVFITGEETVEYEYDDNLLGEQENE